jgi:hypothetical protein
MGHWQRRARRRVVTHQPERRITGQQRHQLMGGACAKAYGWSPEKG